MRMIIKHIITLATLLLIAGCGPAKGEQAKTAPPTHYTFGDVEYRLFEVESDANGSISRLRYREKEQGKDKAAR